jgi:putative zinc finger protein
MKCAQAKSMFSPYLDGALTGTQMHALSKHMEGCSSCQGDYVSLQQVQELLGKIGPRRVPADAGLALRVAMSREIARSKHAYFEGVMVRLENTLNAFMVPVTAGLVTAIVIFGLLMGFLALPGQLQASYDDVPLMIYTAPQLQQSAFTTLDSISDDSLVIEADVDSRGRVQDYRILSNPRESQDLLPQVKNMLIFTTFRPATSMGHPTTGKAVLSFSKISVRG